MGRVSLVKTDRGVKPALVRALDLVGGLGQFVGRTDRVMLKPNLNGEEGCTSRDLVAALIELLSDFGVGRIVIGESTFGDARMTDAFFKKSGFVELSARYGVSLLNLNASQAVEVKVAHPLVTDTLRIAREALEVDRLVNLPNMKVHYATGITLALKNLKGLLVRDEKRRFHEIGLDRAIVDLNNTVKAQLQVADCISCMERMGPRGGDLVRLDLIMAGASAAEVDWVGCQVMEHSLDEVGHLKLFVETNEIDLDAVATAGETIASVKHPFRRAVLASVFSPKIQLHERNACSACMNAFLLSCQLLCGEPEEVVDVYLGTLPDESTRRGKLRLAFGNCVPDDGAFDIRIRGCPPYPFALKGVLESRH
jgi:uncharacterized protein (DUF362 family)